MKTRWLACVAALTLVAAVLACSTSSVGGPSVSERATSLSMTGAALLTGTAVASITPETATPPPTESPAATASRRPTTTLAPDASAGVEPTLIRTPTQPAPLPSATQTPCENDKAEFVADVNVPDGTHFAAGAAFEKTWRLRNNGNCTWTTVYTLRNVAGELMGGSTINLPNTVPPGATVDVTVSFVAPNSPGKHTSSWQLFTPDGAAFGTKPFVQITVP